MDVVRKELKNGLIVATEAMPHLRSVSIGVWIRGGSRQESECSPGISHFIEHLLFKGTRSRSASEIAKAIDSVGGQLNAFTDKEYVGFYARVIDKHLAFVFELLSDIVLNPSFPAAEMERERNVIYEEINMVEDSPQELIQDVFMEHFWKGHPLGRPISGTKDSVARITRREVIGYFKQNYTGCNTIISVAGNFRHREVQALAGRYFASLDRGVAANPGRPPEVHAGRVVRRKPHLEQTHICLGIRCPPMNSGKRYCTHILSSVLGGAMSSRLFQNIRERRGLVYSIYSTPNQFSDAGNLLVYAAAAPEKAAQVVELILKEFRKMRASRIPSGELARAKENIKGSVMLSLESSGSRMTQLAQQLIYFDRFYSLEEIVRGFDRVQSRDVLALANEIFDPRAMTLTALTSRNGRDLKSVEIDV